MTNDPIADLLIQIKNGYMAKMNEITLPHSITKESICQILQKGGFIGKVEVKDEGKVKKNLKIHLIYDGKKAKMTDVVRISKPGRRVYVDRKSIPKVLGGLGMSIISTSSGIMSGREAKKKNLGGEFICKIW